MMFRFLQIFALLLGLFAFGNVAFVAAETEFHSEKNVFVVISKQNNITDEFIETLAANSRINFDVITTASLRNDKPCDLANCLYITLGHSALDEAAGTLNKAYVLSVLTSSITFENKAPDSARVSAIYAEPDLENQIELIQSIYQKDFSIGVLYSEKSLQSLQKIQTLQKQYGFELYTTLVEDERNLQKNLSDISQADVLLAIPDNNIYNKYNFKNLILTTYANNQPIIGFSRNFVKSGALASSYSDVKHIAEETALNITYFSIANELPEPYYAEKYGISVNDEVSRSLGITIRSEDFPASEFELIKGTRYVER